VVVNDLILDAEGQKMSKSRGNAVNPWDAIDEHGADALRWYLITSSNPWVPKRYDPEGVKEAARKFFDTLFNTYRFFAMYAGVESWEPADDDPAPTDRPLLDRWLLSRLDSVVHEVTRELDAYQLTKAYRALGDFVVEDLSNWYVRRSRARFWGNTDEADARAAFRTLWEALREVALLAAPVVPFTADWLYRALAGETVHLQRYPSHAEIVDQELGRTWRPPGCSYPWGALRGRRSRSGSASRCARSTPCFPAGARWTARSWTWSGTSST
jgi:isoleucyl-tRNA synthetase